MRRYFLLAAISLWFAPSQEALAQATTLTATEAFLNDTLKDADESSVVRWYPQPYNASGAIGPSPKISLNPGGASSTNKGNMPVQVVATAAGALGHSRRTSTATDDLVVLSQEGGCALQFYTFNAGPSQDSASLNTLGSTPIATLSSCGAGTALAVGDIDQNGYDDVVVVTINNPNGAGTVTSATVLFNGGNGASWTPLNITAPLQNAQVAWHGQGNPIALADMDGDGALDLVVLSSYGNTAQVVMFAGSPIDPTQGFASSPTVLVPYLPIARPISDASKPPSGGATCLISAGSVSRGATGLAVGDLNQDGLLDLAVAAPDDKGLLVLLQQPQGSFALNQTLTLAAGSRSVWARSLDGDASVDLLVLRANDGCNSSSAQVLALYNLTQDGNFTTVGAQAAPATPGQILGTPLSQSLFRSSTFSTFGTAFFFYDPKVLSPFTIAEAYAGNNLYTLTARAQSLDVLQGAGRAQNRCLQSAQVNLSQSLPADTNITLSLSADGGVTFEPLTANELAGKAAHPFVNAGSELVWRMDFAALAANSLGSFEMPFAPASRLQPTAANITLSASLLPPFTYSRATAAVASWSTGGVSQDYLISAAAQVPNNYGLLTAVPLNSVPANPSANFQTLVFSRGVASQNVGSPDAATNPGILWNAGTQLMATVGSSRTLYGAYVPQGTPTLNAVGMSSVATARVALRASELTTPSTSPSLQQLMGLANSTKQGMLQFINSGMNDTLGNKLYDPGHSSPVVLGAPSEDANMMGTTTVAAAYRSYQSNQANRGPVVLMGSNGGMMHAFDGRTGQEMWGLTPANLLGKLKTQARKQATSSTSSSLIYRHQYFVDGPITVADIYAGNRWRTIAVAGQGQGTGSDGNSYYFALDVTDPTSPVPLWEATQAGLDPTLSCDGRAPSPQTPQCNNRPDMQCCPYNSSFFCAPISSGCSQVPASMGQALSKAAIGRVQTSVGDVWVAFFASGYNRLGVPNVGQSIYAVNAFTGVPMGTWNLPDVPGPSGTGAILPSLVAGVKLVDADGDGYVDRLYVGDLAGRMWKLNTWAKAAVSGTGTMGDPNQWPTCLIYDAGAGAAGGRGAAPIVSTAGVAVFDTEAVNIYFGTGGDDSAPSDQSYSFFGIRDSDGLDICSSGQHTGPLLTALGEFKLQDPSAGFRFWAEPTVVDGMSVYFSSFFGSLERIADLANLENQSSHLYGIAIRPFTDSAGRAYRAGQSVLSGGVAFYKVSEALRTAPMVRGQAASSVTRAIDPATASSTSKDLLIQEGQGNVLWLPTTGAQLSKPPALKQVRWRQVTF